MDRLRIATPEINCVRCAHAHVPPEKGPCPQRDFTMRMTLCPTDRSWNPLTYLAMLGINLTPAQAAERAAADLKHERQLSPRERLERRVGTDLQKAEETFLVAFEAIDDAAKQYLQTLDVDTSSMVQTIRRATAIDTIKRSLTDQIIKSIAVPLMDNPMGFMTDRKTEQTPYPITVIRDCLCQVMLHGARIDGNEFNIIKGSPMLVQNYWKRQVRELPITDLAVEFGSVEAKGNEAFVECLARWNDADGKPQEISRRANVKHAGTEWDRRIVVPMNRAMGRDAVIGKAERRIYKEIYERATGRRIQGMDEDDVINADSKPLEPAEEPEDFGANSGVVDSTAVAVQDSEDAQEVADHQSQLKSVYFKDLGEASDADAVTRLMEQAKQEKTMAPHTLEEIIQAGKNKFRSFQPRKS